MQRIAVILALITLLLSFAACGKEFTCDHCNETKSGNVYYGSNYSDNLCAECAADYWEPFPIENYKK